MITNQMHRMVFLLALATLFSCRCLPAETTAGLTVDAPSQGQRSRLATYEVDFRVSISPPEKTKTLRVWLPLPSDDSAQRITDRRMATFPRSVQPSIHTEPMFGNTFAYFEFDSPSGAQLITHQFTAQVHQLDWQVDYHSVIEPAVWPESFAPFRRIDPRTKEGDQLQEVLVEIGQSTRSSADRLVNAMKWVDDNLTYDHDVASLSANPMHGLVHRRGHCSDYHGLCSTLAQKVGYPSRVLYGLQMFDKASPSHCKMEVFLPPFGWVPYDLSETQKLVLKIAGDDSLSPAQRNEKAARAKQRTMQGFRENTWLQVTRGTNYDLAPPASHRVPLVRTIYAEADGKPLDDPDPSNKTNHLGAWTTMYRVDGDAAARRFQVIDE